jgi:nitrate reductase gamma subunit
LFGIVPYVALGVAAVGLGLRLILAARAQAVTPSNIDGWDMLGTGLLGRWALLALLAGHGLLLAAPGVITRWAHTRNGLYLIECTGFLLGLTALAGVISGLRRHLGSARGTRRAEIADAVFLSSLLMALCCGLYAAARFRWASLWGAATVAPYARTLVQGRPSPSLLAGIPFAARLHLAATFGAIASLPPSRLGGAVAQSLWALIDAPAAALHAAARAVAQRSRPQRFRDWLWPEEDLADLARETRRRVVVERRAARARRPSAVAAPPEIFAGLAAQRTPGDTEPDVPTLSAEGGG